MLIQTEPPFAPSFWFASICNLQCTHIRSTIRLLFSFPHLTLVLKLEHRQHSYQCRQIQSPLVMQSERIGTLTAGLAWGVPVDPAKLLAHLEVYVSMKPVILTLRLCVRFGRGPAAYIKNLPLEVLSVIEFLVLREPRRLGREKKRLQQHCYESTCHPSDHMTDEEQDDSLECCYADDSDLETHFEHMEMWAVESSECLERHVETSSIFHTCISQHTGCSHFNCFSSRFDNVSHRIDLHLSQDPLSVLGANHALGSQVEFWPRSCHTCQDKPGHAMHRGLLDNRQYQTSHYCTPCSSLCFCTRLPRTRWEQKY